MKQHYLFISCLLMVCLFTHCVSEIEIKNQTYAEFVVVDGVLNYGETADSNDLTVRLSISVSGALNTAPLSKAVVELVVNDKDAYTLPEREAGYYYLFDKNVLKVGNSYKLRFKANGQNYESSAEVLPDSTSFVKTYAEVNPNGNTAKAFEVFVDVNDPPQKKNHYRWAITQWERLEYCLYCYKQGRNPEFCNEDIYPLPDLTLTRNPFCAGDCYAIIRSTPNNAISDVFFDGKMLLKKSIGYVPYVFSTGCLVQVEQSSLTPSYFAFLEILKTQAENTGGLADTPAAVLTGNVRNVNNSSQKILGYFSVTNTTKRRFWLDRSAASTAGIRSYASLYPPLDPPTPTPASWYPVPCKPSKVRTNIKPQGFR